MELYRLAAVDMHTAHHLLRYCLTGDLARDRTIILVTHHIRLCLPAASYFVEISQGTVRRQGCVQDLRDQGALVDIVDAEDQHYQDEPNQSRVVPNEVDTPQDESRELLRTNARKKKIIEEEARAEGRVSFRIYLTYIRAAGIHCWIITLLLMLLIRFINIGNQVRENSLSCIFRSLIGQLVLSG
jgi:ABC-type multidrug transport system ATPase subunit